MVIHSVTPAYFLGEQNLAPQLECKSFNSGFILGTQDNNNFIISRIISTDPKAYLDNNLSPGSIYKN